jgi:hypothetical protein
MACLVILESFLRIYDLLARARCFCASYGDLLDLSDVAPCRLRLNTEQFGGVQFVVFVLSNY